MSDLIFRIEELLKYETAGDPITGLKWTRKTTEKISQELCISGIYVSSVTVGKIIKNLGFSLKLNVKKLSSGGKKKTPEEEKKRDAQFNYIACKRKDFKENGYVTISCDTKKKEVIGNFKNPGTRYKKKADLVNDHDFISYCDGKAAPYGIYDCQKNEGFVAVGEFMKEPKKSRFLSADTPEFAVESIEQWWLQVGINMYKYKKILILVDAGGSNGYRNKMWKVFIQKILCDRHGLEVTVCHYPPGASKWNPIEHRLFSEISKNWRGTPLINFETVINYIQTTKTKTGLKVKAIPMKKQYIKGIKATQENYNALRLVNHDINKLWNYTIHPRNC
ncbi:MAG: ISAzo13 family transposase [Candidatus Cloacimonadota bacterium]|nr:ISAzo13 family transposase [Candidatus Cloacimonadota bacterium]